MAYTKILVIHERLDTRVNYILNPAKTTERTKDLGVAARHDAADRIDDHGPQASDGLFHALDYALNPEKNGQRVYQGAVNCMVDTAFHEMMETKKRWSKTGKRQGYHIIQSFKPGEISPDLAIEVGRRFAERYLADRYQAVYSVHLDREHMHVHIVFNSVSFVDGRKYHADKHEYERNIQRISDELCREYKLSVIERKEPGMGKSHAEHQAERNSRPTVRGLIREDIDAAIAQAFTFKGFIDLLRARGYAVKQAPNIKYMAVSPPGSGNYFRLYRLGEGYDEEAIRNRILRQRHGAKDQGTIPAGEERRSVSSTWAFNDQATHVTGAGTGLRTQADASNAERARTMPHANAHAPPRTTHRVTILTTTLRRTVRLRGFQALVFHYLFLLGKVQKRQAPMKRLPFHIRAEITKYDRYAARFRFLTQNRIETDGDLRGFTLNSYSLIDTLADRRSELYAQRRRLPDASSEKAALSAQIAALTAVIRPLRRDVRLAERISADSGELRERYDAIRTAMRMPQIPSKERASINAKPRPRPILNRREETDHEPRR